MAGFSSYFLGLAPAPGKKLAPLNPGPKPVTGAAADSTAPLTLLSPVKPKAKANTLLSGRY